MQASRLVYLKANLFSQHVLQLCKHWRRLVGGAACMVVQGQQQINRHFANSRKPPRLWLAVVKVAQLHQRPVSGLYVQKRYLQISSNVVKRSADVAGHLFQHFVTSGVCNSKTAQLQAFKNQGQFGCVADGQQSRAQQ